MSFAEATEQLVNADETKASPELLIERFKGMGFEITRIERAVADCDGKEEVALQKLLEEQ